MPRRQQLPKSHCVMLPRHKNIMQTRFDAPRIRLAGQQEKRNDACQFESHLRNLDKKPFRI
jgi:hypothetical protein